MAAAKLTYISPNPEAYNKGVSVKKLCAQYDICKSTAYNWIRKYSLKVKQSFSNPGTPLDNAVAESFFACMKREELSHNYYDTIEELQRDVDEYVEFFNNMRPHQRLGMQTPSEVERNFAVKK